MHRYSSEAARSHKPHSGQRGAIALVGLLLTLAACSAPINSAAVPPEPPPARAEVAPTLKPISSPRSGPRSGSIPPVASNAIDPQLVEANTRFGLKLMQQLRPVKSAIAGSNDNSSGQKPDQNLDKNLFISPLSISMALALAYNGANGETQAAMQRSLELQGLTVESLNQANGALLQFFAPPAGSQGQQKPGQGMQLNIANSLWANRALVMQPDFLTRIQPYQAQVQVMDFAKPETVKVINDWVADQTLGKIPTILNQIEPDELLYLINAVYFKGTWEEPFDPAETQPKPFYPGGKQGGVAHPRMTRSGEFAYQETPLFQAVSLPYKSNSPPSNTRPTRTAPRLSLDVFLPKTDLADFLTQLTPQNWKTWSRQFGSRPGRLELPRFKLEYEADLKPALTRLGLGVAFSPQADFSRLTSQPSAISQVRHKTWVEVNEEGTEAAAATAIGIMPTSARIPQKPFEMVVDRPFFCAIRDQQTGTILFMGIVTRPK